MSVGPRLRGLVGVGAEGREHIVGSALELLDDVGLDGLTMRTLAERMGVRAASLYWHIRDKEQLLGLLAEAIIGEVPEPALGLPWRTQMETFAAAYRRVLQSHRDAARIVTMAQPVAPRLYERLVRVLLAAGFDGRVAVDACHLVVGTYVPAAVVEETEVGALQEAEQGRMKAPLGALARGRLQISGGVAAMKLHSDPSLAELYAGQFKDRLPTVQVQGGNVHIAMRHRRLQLKWWDINADLALNPAIPWDVEIGDGAWKLHADLRGLRLRSLTIGGGAADVTLLLPPAIGTVPVRMSGGVYKLIVSRPTGAAVRLRVAQSAGNLTLDAVRQANVDGGEFRWETPAFSAVPDRYDVEIDGGAYRVTFDSAGDRAGEPASVPASAGGEQDPGAEALSPEELTNLASQAVHLANPDLDARFEFGLSVLLDGLQRRLPPA
jgi:TetR/AcrR family tetracycline transcriptional repressor